MKEFSNIEAVILDKDGVFVNFQKLWLRVIAYRAQLIAELSCDNSEAFAKVRAACIRAMGIDEDDETVDPIGPAAMPADSVRLALATALYINKNDEEPSFSWSHAFRIVDDSMVQTKEALDIIEMSEPIEGSVEKIKEIVKAGLKVAVYTSDAEEHAKKTIEKFEITKEISALQAGELKTEENYRSLCKVLKVNPENTILLTDSPIDLKAAKAAGAKAIVVYSGVVDKTLHQGLINGLADDALDSMADLDLNNLGKKKAVV